MDHGSGRTSGTKRVPSMTIKYLCTIVSSRERSEDTRRGGGGPSSRRSSLACMHARKLWFLHSSQKFRQSHPYTSSQSDASMPPTPTQTQKPRGKYHEETIVIHEDIQVDGCSTHHANILDGGMDIAGILYYYYLEAAQSYPTHKGGSGCHTREPKPDL